MLIARAPACRMACCDHQGIAAPPLWAPRREPAGRSIVVGARRRRAARGGRGRGERSQVAVRARGGSSQTARQPRCPADLAAAHRDPRRRRGQDLPVLQGRTGSARTSASDSRHPSRSRIILASRASFRSTASLAMARLQTKVTSASTSAGRICGAASTSAPSPKRRPSPTRRCSASARSIGWKPTFVAGQATRRPPETIASAFRRTQTVAARKARARQPEELARPGDPLCALH